MRIKILKEDKVFSQVVRLRDMRCVRCESRVRTNDKGLPVSHQCSHFWGRGNWSTRFDLNNCDTLCFACHRLWGGDYRDDYKAFKLKQLGKKKYQELERLKNTPANKRKMLEWAYPYYKEMLKKYDKK